MFGRKGKKDWRGKESYSETLKTASVHQIRYSENR